MSEFIPVCEPSLLGNEKKYVMDAMESGWISSAGKYIPEFENAFANYLGMNHGVAVTNGTAALHIALLTLGIGPGDEVIIPSFTMIASAFAVIYVGAKPVIVDVDPDTWNIDPDLVRQKITKNTKAIMPVHVFGTMCNMNEITRIAHEYELFIVEDAAEAHGAKFENKMAGSFSDMAAFSFYSNKNIATGEGGMVVTNDPSLAEKARYFKNLCFPMDGSRNYIHAHLGFNYRMTNLHAAIGLAQVEKADTYREMRIRNNSIYRRELYGTPGIIFQEVPANTLSVHWMNTVVIVPSKFGCNKDAVMANLKRNNIDTRLLFTGMHLQPALTKYINDRTGDFRNTDYLTENGFYLPSASHLTEEQITRICRSIKETRSHG